MVSIYLDDGAYRPTVPSNTRACGGISTRWSFGMEMGRGSGGGLCATSLVVHGTCATSEKISSLLYRGGGTFRNVDTPTIWLDKGAQRVLEVGGYGFLYVRVTCGCKVLLDMGCGVREITFLIMEGELPEVLTITNGVIGVDKDVEVEVGILRDSTT